MPNLELRSERSTTKAFVRFLNKTERTVDIVWINFQGKYIKYKTLSPNQYVDVDTYTGHPWLFLDADTRDRMLVRGKDVFFAEPWFSRFRFIETRGAVIRVCIPIKLPLYTLKTCTLLAVRNLLKNESDIPSLELPEILKRDLILAFNLQNIDIIPLSYR